MSITQSGQSRKGAGEGRAARRRASLFTAEELAEIAAADAAIGDAPVLPTPEERSLSRALDRVAEGEGAASALPPTGAAAPARRRKPETPEQREDRLRKRKAWRAAHREELREKCAAYNAAHREERRDYQRAYDAAHRAAHLKKWAERPEERKLKKRAYARAYLAAHREEINARRRARYAALKEKRRGTENGRKI